MTISYTKLYQCDRCQFIWTEGDVDDKPIIEIIVRADKKFIWGDDIYYTQTKTGYTGNATYGHLCALCTKSFLHWVQDGQVNR